MPENIRTFGTMPDGEKVYCVSLTGGDLSCEVLTYGGTLRSLTVPSLRGPLDVVLGFDRIEDYLVQNGSCGALVGRYANRIGGASFSLNGKTYHLCKNDGENSLHGGINGFGRRLWSIEKVLENRLELLLISEDGDEGYPGRMEVRASYELEADALTLEFNAVSDADTVCSLTSHAYFNLSGHASGPVSAQQVSIIADAYTPTDAALIPTGELLPVDGTHMDLRAGVEIGEGGYDHNWVIRGMPGTLRPAASAFSPDTGVCMDVLTTQPGVQFYSGGGMDGFPVGKDGAAYAGLWGFCLETQAFPNSPNTPAFPSAVLEKGGEYRQKTVFKFSVRR